MDKLSSILPASPRVQAVDMSEAPPVRPGAPTFGRPVGVSTVKDRFSVSQEAKDVAFKDTLGAVKSKEARGAKIVDAMSKKFFETKNEIQSKPMAVEAQEREMDFQEEAPRAVTQKVEVAQVKEPVMARSGAHLDVQG